MDAVITGKFIRIFLAAVFIAGIISVALCLTGGPRVVSACCHSKAPAAAKDTEDCLTHCAKQKVFALKEEVYSQERPELKALLGLKAETIIFLNNPAPKISVPAEFYLHEAIPKLLPSQIYLATHFTLAPPVVQ